MHFLTHQKIVPSAWQSLRMAIPPHGNFTAWQLYIINYTLYIKRNQASPLHEEACLEFSFSLSKN